MLRGFEETLYSKAKVSTASYVSFVFGESVQRFAGAHRILALKRGASRGDLRLLAHGFHANVNLCSKEKISLWTVYSGVEPLPLPLLSPCTLLPSSGSILSPPPPLLPPPPPPFLPLLLPSPCPPQWNPPLLCRVRFVQADFLQLRAGAVTVRLIRFLSITT